MTMMWQFVCQYHYWLWSYDNSFIRDWPEIQKSEIPSSEFWWISGQPQCPDIRDTKFHKMSLMKPYWMLQNTRFTAFYCFWVIIFWVINSGDKITPPPNPPTQITVNGLFLFRLFFLHFNKLNSITNFLWF